MYRKISDFLSDWNHETENTIKILSALTDDSLSQKIYENGRELGRLGFHLTQALGAFFIPLGLNPEIPGRDAEVPVSAAEILNAYKRGAESVVNPIKEWSDESLDQDVEMFGRTFKRGQALMIAILHQTHHRGQMTVLMRQAGLRVPGVYGPAREEWVAMGAPAMA